MTLKIEEAIAILDPESTEDVNSRYVGLPVNEILEIIDEAGRMGAAALRAQLGGAADPNDPLTLEELREMDGEPVWVKSAFGRMCALVEVSSAESGRVYLHTVNEHSRMNQREFLAWSAASGLAAYRHKPADWAVPRCERLK